MIKCPCSEPQFKFKKIWGQNSTSQKLKLNSRKNPHINLTFLKPKIILPTYKNLTILITVFVLNNSLNGAILTSFLSFSTFHSLISFTRTDCNFAEAMDTLPKSNPAKPLFDYLSISMLCNGRNTELYKEFFLNKGPHL